MDSEEIMTIFPMACGDPNYENFEKFFLWRVRTLTIVHDVFSWQAPIFMKNHRDEIQFLVPKSLNYKIKF